MCLVYDAMQGWSVYKREVVTRRQFERHSRMVTQTHMLALEERRSYALLDNMLPKSIVKQLTVSCTTFRGCFSFKLLSHVLRWCRVGSVGGPQADRRPLPQCDRPVHGHERLH